MKWTSTQSFHYESPFKHLHQSTWSRQCLLKIIPFCYDNLLPQTGHKRRGTLPQTRVCHHKGRTVETFDLEIYKVNSMPLQLLTAFSPCFICQHLSPSVHKNKLFSTPCPSYCLFKLACPTLQPSTLYSLNCQYKRSKSLSGPLFHIRNGLCVCQFWVSGKMKWGRQRERGGETTYGVYDECSRGQYMFSVIIGGGGGWILEDAPNVTHTDTHMHRPAETQIQTHILTVPVWLL